MAVDQGQPGATPGDGVAPGKLRRLDEGASAEKDPAANAKKDREVAATTRTVQPGSDAPSRSGIMGSGSGADIEKG